MLSLCDRLGGPSLPGSAAAVHPACAAAFTVADEKPARDLHQRGVTLAQVARAVWLGCARKYTTLLSSQAVAMPIASLSYFAAVNLEIRRRTRVVGIFPHAKYRCTVLRLTRHVCAICPFAQMGSW
jgi:hypothetical protein